MYFGLIQILDLLIRGLGGLRKIKEESERKKNVLGLLKISIFMNDLVKDGRKLLDATTPDPTTVIEAVNPEEASNLLHDWEKILKRQRTRLLAINELLRGQHCLSIISPGLEAEICEIIGDKFQRSSKLYSVANNLYFGGFGEKEDSRWQCRVIKMMFQLNEDGALDLKASRKELDGLQSALNKYGRVVGRLVSKKDLVSLSTRARKEATIEDD